jgi:hypothetical protein
LYAPAKDASSATFECPVKRPKDRMSLARKSSSSRVTGSEGWTRRLDKDCASCESDRTFRKKRSFANVAAASVEHRTVSERFQRRRHQCDVLRSSSSSPRYAGGVASKASRPRHSNSSSCSVEVAQMPSSDPGSDSSMRRACARACTDLSKYSGCKECRRFSPYRLLVRKVVQELQDLLKLRQHF